MEQTVRVRTLHDDGTATVIHTRESACSGDCHKCSGCGAAKESILFEAQNTIGARPGELVTVRSETAPVMKAVAIFYVLPLVLFFALYCLGQMLLSAGALPGCAGFVLGIVLAVIYDRRVARKEKTVYTIVGYADASFLETRNKGDNRND